MMRIFEKQKWKKNLKILVAGLLSAAMLMNSNLFFVAADDSTEDANIALNKTAVFTKADGSEVVGAWGNNASHAVDGNTGTVAQPAYRGPLDFTVDLGTSYMINEIVINWDSAHYSDCYKIKSSLDGVSFSEVSSLEDQGGGEKKIKFSDGIECRYIRIEMSSLVGGGEYGEEGFGVGIWEFSVKGDSLSDEVNLALHKRVKMLDDDKNEISAAWGNVAANAVDGNGGSVAQASSDSWNLFVDLGAEARVSSFEINNFWASCITECEIRTSLDGINWQSAVSDVKPPENKNSVIELAEKINCRYVLLDVKSYSGAEGCIADFAVNGIIVKEEKNISLQKTAFITENGQDVTFWNGPENAIDGNNDSYVQAAVNVPWDLTIDLESVYDITSIELQLNWANYAKKYDLMVSNDGINWTTIYEENNGTGDAKMLYDLDQVYTARYVKLDVQETVGGGDTWGHAIHEVTVKGNASISLSQGKTVKAVSIEDGNIDISCWTGSEGAVDGNEETYLQSKGNIPWDMIVDLGDFYDIHTVRYVADAENYAVDFDIEISNNGYSWTSIKNVTENSKNWLIYSYSEPKTARYIRLNVTNAISSGMDAGHAVREWNVYGQKAAEVPSAEITDIELDKNEVNLLQGESAVIHANLTPAETSAIIEWSSDNTQVAAVDKYGTITAQGSGTTKVWAKASGISQCVVVNVEGNIALNKPAVMSISHGWDNTAQCAVDGNYSTVAQGNQNVKWELTIDLEDYYNIKAISIAMDDYNYASKYQIMGSINGVGWTEILEENNFVPMTVNKYTFAEQLVRYVRLVPLDIVGGGDNYGYAIQELEIVGTKASGLENDAVDKIEFQETEIELVPNEVKAVIVNITPINSTAKVFWKSSDETVATVDGAGNITAVSGGVCTVTVTAGTKEASMRVYVKEDLAKGKTATMSIPAGYGNVANYAIDGSQATLAQGAYNDPWDLTVDLEGSYEINLIKIWPDYYNYAKKFDLLVSQDGQNYIKVVSETEMKGEPKSYSFQTVQARYIKMDVHEAVVSGTDCGHAIIDFEVYGPLVKVESAVLEESAIMLGTNEIYAIPLNVTPENATIKRARYHSSDENVVTVDENGNIKGVSTGKAVITVTTYDGDIQNQLDVEVYESLNISYGKTVTMSSPAGFSNVGAYAVDWKTDTYAQAAENVKWTLMVDLGMNVKISRVNVIQDDFNFASRFAVKVSKDGEKWETAATCNKVLQSGTSVRFPAVEARYVLFEPLEIVGGGTGYGYAIREFEIYNAYGVDLDKIKPLEIFESGPKNYEMTSEQEEITSLETSGYLNNKIKAITGEVSEYHFSKKNILLWAVVGLLIVANLGLLTCNLITKKRKSKNKNE